MVNIRLSYEPLYGKLLGVALHSRIGELPARVGGGGAGANGDGGKVTARWPRLGLETGLMDKDIKAQLAKVRFEV